MKSELQQSLFRLLVALAIGLVVSGVFILIIHVSPLSAYGAMLKGAFVGKLNILTTLRWSVPYVITGIASAIAIRAGMFNMGLDGCVCLGGLAAALVGAYVKGIPPVLHVSLSLAAAMLVGVLWMYIPARLKADRGVNEVIMTWMLSYIAILLCQYLVTEIFQRPEDVVSAVQQVRTPRIFDSAKLPQLVKPYQLNAGLYIALALGLGFYVFCNRTGVGYEHNMTGLAMRFAEYGGVDIRRTQFYSLIVSSAVGALAGAVEVLGVHYRYIQGFANDMGANGIMVSLMGRVNPVGVPLAGLFMGSIQNGARAMSRDTDVSLDTVRILISVIVICITAEGLYEILRIKKKAREGD
jgi:general nucleoside transport system permease protein